LHWNEEDETEELCCIALSNVFKWNSWEAMEAFLNTKYRTKASFFWSVFLYWSRTHSLSTALLIIDRNRNRQKPAQALTWNSGNFGVLFFGRGNEGASRICKTKWYIYIYFGKTKQSFIYDISSYLTCILTFWFNGRALNLRAGTVMYCCSLGLSYKHVNYLAICVKDNLVPQNLEQKHKPHPLCPVCCYKVRLSWNSQP